MYDTEIGGYSCRFILRLLLGREKTFEIVMTKEEVYRKLFQALVDAVADYIVQRMFEFAQISPYLAIFMAVMIVSRTFLLHRPSFRLLHGKLYFTASKNQSEKKYLRAIR